MGSEVPDDYYTLLGVAADADPAHLRRVWRRLALRWHPDRAGPAATPTFQKISTAYAVLSDPVARAAYDRRPGAPARRTAPDTAETPAGAPRPRAPGVMLSRLSAPLNALLAQGVARRDGPGIIELNLNPEEAAQGGMITISMLVPVLCAECGADDPSCPRCSGKGTTDEVFSAWLAVPPGVADCSLLHPSELLPDMLHPLRFRIRLRAARR